MKCNHCGKEIINDSRFCNFCGKRVYKKSVPWWSVLLIVLGVIIIILMLLILLNNRFSCYIEPTVKDTVIVENIEYSEEVFPTTESQLYTSPARKKIVTEAKTSKSVPAGYMDLGLSVYWKTSNEKNPVDDYDHYTYNEAKEKFGKKLPTKEQFKELKSKCSWTWKGDGYRVTGSNGNSIFLPAAGGRGCLGDVGLVGMKGYYWSSTPDGGEDAWHLYFDSWGMDVGCDGCCSGQSVRLVHGK